MVIIVGAGASGMMAAFHLSSKGIPVTVLEARDRLGGRIHTTNQGGFSFPVEAGAEFIHGDLPLTLSLLRAGGIPLIPSGGKFARFRDGEWQSGFGRAKGWDKLMKGMKRLKEDMPLQTFLETYFASPSDASLRNAARAFAEGYDLADIRSASTHALYREWTKEEGDQHRIDGGYGRMIDFMGQSVRAAGGVIHKGVPVTEIVWERGSAVVHCLPERSFSAHAVLVTVPLPLLGSDGPRFSPAIPAYLSAASALGFGTVIKVVLEFDAPFWNEAVPGMGFVLSDQALPTWWSQAPASAPFLTGWLAGPRALPYLGRPAEEILAVGLESLGNIFKTTPAALKVRLKASRVDDWSTDPYALGGYSFPTVGEATPRRLLNTPVQDTLFFGGEGLYEGEHSPGTVEAALASGLAAAERILARS